MERSLLARLDQWRGSAYRKPLLLMGQRQVGKTWLLREFGRRSYTDVAYFNFEANPSLGEVFLKTKDPARIVEHLSALHGSPITPDRSLLILDEIQESNAALNSLKYFNEDAPSYHVACAGSLIGVTLSRPSSFPVGQVDFLTLHPMSFTEFLRAGGDGTLVSYLDSVSDIEPVLAPIANRLTEQLSRYVVIGGMPRVVDLWVRTHDMSAARAEQEALLRAYELDFSKHAPEGEIARLGYLWRSIPSQLARENRKFVYNAAREGARARQYENALNWLTRSGTVTRVFAASAPRLPLPAYDDLASFKIYSADTGLLARQSGLDLSTLGDPVAPFKEFKGALTENLVLQSLIGHFDVEPRYWRSKGEAEVEFLLQRGADIHPIEVKAGTSVRSKSLSVYRKSFAPRLSVRFSLRDLRYGDGLLDVPLYLADRLDALIADALERAR